LTVTERPVILAKNPTRKSEDVTGYVFNSGVIKWYVTPSRLKVFGGTNEGRTPAGVGVTGRTFNSARSALSSTDNRYLVTCLFIDLDGSKLIAG